MSQGVGPAEDRRLVRRARSVLPRVGLVSTRDRTSSPRLLAALGVRAERLAVAGDDAVLLAYDNRPAEPSRSGLGVSLRTAGYAGTAESDAELLRPAVLALARELGTELLPLPISQHPDGPDTRSIGAVLDEDTGAGREIDTPLEAVLQAGRCRVVLAGSYHAAVFALAQGVPVVGLARSPYYEAKLLGAAEQFEAGFELVRLDGPDPAAAVARAVRAAWDPPEGDRATMLTSARRQIAAADEAYERLRVLIEARA